MFTWPVPGYYTVSDGYWAPRPYGLHGAIDIGAPKVPTVAIGAGHIIFVGWAGDAGLSVYLDMGTFRAHYCHLDSVNVSVGQAVQAGDVIGTVGASTRGVRDYPNYPNHLHLNLFTPQRPATGPSHWVGWVGMWCVDPELYLSKEDDVELTDEQHKMLQTIHHMAKIAAPEERRHSHHHLHVLIPDAFKQVRADIAALRAEVKALNADKSGGHNH